MGPIKIDKYQVIMYFDDFIFPLSEEVSKEEAEEIKKKMEQKRESGCIAIMHIND